uniref:Mitochondrial fission process protein 1 n=1 Tax=Sinocyclocheilus rhinocerous TaxID=307959 RepID=A0A673JIK0_9TELE
MEHTPEKHSKEVDIYRDTWVRFLGYANEVGEAFRALVPVSAVWASYAVATAYVSADALDKGRKAAAVSLDQSESVSLSSSRLLFMMVRLVCVCRLTLRIMERRGGWPSLWSTRSSGRLWLQWPFLDSQSTAFVPRRSSCWEKPHAGHFLCASGPRPPSASPPSHSSSHPSTGEKVCVCVRESV